MQATAGNIFLSLRSGSQIIHGEITNQSLRNKTMVEELDSRVKSTVSG
jgi:hypothetical protein